MSTDWTRRPWLPYFLLKFWRTCCWLQVKMLFYLIAPRYTAGAFSIRKAVSFWQSHITSPITSEIPSFIYVHLQLSMFRHTNDLQTRPVTICSFAESVPEASDGRIASSLFLKRLSTAVWDNGAQATLAEETPEPASVFGSAALNKESMTLADRLSSYLTKDLFSYLREYPHIKFLSTAIALIWHNDLTS